MPMVPTDPPLGTSITTPEVPPNAEPSDDAYQRYFHNNPVPMWIYDITTLAYLDVNHAATIEYGYSREEFLGMTILDLRPPEERPKLLAFLAGQSPDASYSGGPWTHRRKDGSQFEIIARFKPTAHNGIKARIACSMDVSRQMRVQRLLERQHDILQRIAANHPLQDILEHIVDHVESQPGGMLGTILLVNPNNQTLRLGAGQHMPPGYNAAIEGISIAIGNGACGHAAATGTRYVARDVQTDANFQDYRDLLAQFGLASCTSEPIFSGREVIATFAVYSRHKGEPNPDQLQLMETAAHLASIAIERHREQEQLQSSEEHFRQLAEAAPLIVWATLPSGSSAYYNTEFFSYTGLPAGPLTSEQVIDTIHPEDRAAIKAVWFNGSEKGSPYELSVRLRRFDGEYRWHLCRGRPVISEAGKIIRWLGTATDIDAAKHSQEKSLAAAEIAQAANLSKDRFLAVLSHELRTPLSPVLASLTGMLAWSDLPPAVREELAMIRRNVELEARIIDDLLDLTRISRGKMQLNKTRVDVQSLLRLVADICRQDIVDKRQSLTLDLPLADAMADADAARMQQVFWNLLKNAVKFTPPGGAIRISTSRHNNRLAVEVADSGRGITPEKLDVIFDAFEQADPRVTREFGGLGLGLAISRMIVALHGGTIVARSAGLGLGATFRVDLPLCNAASDAAPEIDSRPPPFKTPALASQCRTILMVEDHPDTAKVMGRMLKALGHDVTIATTVAEAINLGLSRDFDVLLSDIGLPDGSGTEIARALLPHKPIHAIALSGFGMESDIRRSKEAGFLEHLTKPVDLDRLQAVLQTLPPRDVPKTLGN